MSTPKQTEAFEETANADLLLSWTPGVQLVNVQVRIYNVPDSGSARLTNFSTNQPDGDCQPMADSHAYRTAYTYSVPELINDKPVHIEVFQYELSCRAHDVQITIRQEGVGGIASTATAKAILN